MTTTTTTALPSSPASLEYETPRAAPARRPGYWFLMIMVAVASGLLFANSFSDAAGFPSAHRPEGALLRVIAGALVAMIVGASFAALIRLARRAAGSLSHATRTPDRAVGFVLVGCGTACMLGATGLEVFVLKYGAYGPLNLGIAPQYVMSGPVLLAQLLCATVLLAGIALSSAGAWSLLAAPRRD